MTKKEQKIADKLKIIKEIKSQDLSPSEKEAFEFLRKKAKEEDKAEYEGKEDVSIKGREALRDSIIVLYNLGYDGIEETDTKIILDSFYLHPKLANKEIIRIIIILDSKEKNGLQSALETIDKLMKELKGTEYQSALSNLRENLKKSHRGKKESDDLLPN